MCEICHMTPCHPQCPNAPEPPAVYYCKVCGEPIVAGETYYEMDSEFYHEECFEDIHLKKDGTYEMLPFGDDATECWRVFTALMTVRNYKQKYAKGR